MDYTKPNKASWNTNIYRPEGQERPAAIKPLTRREQAMQTENFTLAELISMATKRSGLATR